MPPKILNNIYLGKLVDIFTSFLREVTHDKMENWNHLSGFDGDLVKAETSRKIHSDIKHGSFYFF